MHLNYPYHLNNSIGLLQLNWYSINNPNIIHYISLQKSKYVCNMMLVIDYTKPLTDDDSLLNMQKDVNILMFLLRISEVMAVYP